jgi:hypothetical protein
MEFRSEGYGDSEGDGVKTEKAINEEIQWQTRRKIN